MRKRFGFIILFLLLFALTGCQKPEYKLEGPSTVSVEVGESKNLTLTVSPEESVGDVKVVIDKPNIAKATLTGKTLKVEGLAAGSAKITLTLEDQTLVINVTVTPKEEVEIPVYEEKTILEILQNGKNNDKVAVTGVVYGVTNNGFYLEDSDTGKIYVTLSETTELNVGDKVKLEAEYGLVSGYPRLKNAKVVESLGTAEVYGTPVTNKTIQELLALDKANKIGTYANIFSIVGTIVKSQAGYYQLVDEEANSVQFTTLSNISLFEGKENSRFEIKVILHDFNLVTNKWQVTFVGTDEDIVSKPVTLDEVLHIIQNDINTLPKHVYGRLDLHTQHPTLPFATYNYSVDENPYMTITDNVASFDIDALKAPSASDVNVSLKVTVSQGEESRVIDYPITLHAIKEWTVSELLANSPEVNYSYVIVKGRVVSLARNQSLSTRSLVIQDTVTMKTTTVDFSNSNSEGDNFILNTDAAFTNIKVGDDVLVHAQYRNVSRLSVLNVTSVEVLSSNNEVVHDYENAHVLNSAESYEDFGLNLDQYLNQLVKFEMPFFAFSTSTVPTQTNWVRIFHNEEVQVYDKQVNKRYFAFLIAAQSENLGNDKWTDWFDIPFSAGPAVQTNVSIYAYALYVSDTYLAFVIPSLDQILFTLADRVDKVLDSQIPVSIEHGETIDLNPHTDLVPGGITWSVDKPLINLDTGLVSVVTESTVVTLTATFSDGEQEVALSREITILVPRTLSVSEVLTLGESGQTLRVEGHFIGYFSDGNDNGVRGLILKDKVTSDVVLINDASDILGAYGQSLINGVAPKVGDELYIRGTYSIAGSPERKEFMVDANTELTIVSNDNVLSWPEESMVVITNQEEMIEFYSNPVVGKIIKFVGTPEVPFAFGGSTSGALSGMNHKFFYNTAATSNNDAKYPDADGKVVSFKNAHNQPNAGEKWWVDLFDLPDNSFVGPTSSNPPIVRYGTFYGIYSAQTGTYHQMNFVNVENFNVPRIGQIRSVLTEGTPGSTAPGETVTLIKNIPGVVDVITWSIDNPLIDLDTGLVSDVSEITNVTLTASFTDFGEAKTLEFVISIVPSVVPTLSITDVLTSSAVGDTVKVTGVVAGFHWNGSSNRTDLSHGIILKDPANNNVMYLTGLNSTYADSDGTYTVGEHPLAIGDVVELFADYVVSAEIGFAGRKELLITGVDAAKLTVVSSGATVTWDLTTAAEITSNEDLSALAENLEYGKIYKMSGPFGFRGSANKYGSGINFCPGYEFSSAEDFSHNASWADRVQRFSIKFDGNEHNLGTKWWETMLNVTADNYKGTKADGHLYNSESVIYFMVGATNSKASSTGSGFGYIQLSVLDPSWVSATRILE